MWGSKGFPNLIFSLPPAACNFTPTGSLTYLQAAICSLQFLRRASAVSLHYAIDAVRKKEEASCVVAHQIIEIWGGGSVKILFIITGGRRGWL